MIFTTLGEFWYLLNRYSYEVVGLLILIRKHNLWGKLYYSSKFWELEVA